MVKHLLFIYLFIIYYSSVKDGLIGALASFKPFSLMTN